MKELVRVYIGSDERGGRGEAILRHGLQKYASCPVQVFVMEPNTVDPPYWGGYWNRGRDHMRPYAGGHGTNFTVFRWTVPEAAGFAGRAIYIDADITVHGDIWDLYSFDLAGACCSIRRGVILFDCEHPFWRSPHWLKVDEMRPSGLGIKDYLRKIAENNEALPLFPVEWDVLDGTEMSPYEAKLNHYTRMSKQPYHPFPDRFGYPETASGQGLRQDLVGDLSRTSICRGEGSGPAALEGEQHHQAGPGTRGRGRTEWVRPAGRVHVPLHRLHPVSPGGCEDQSSRVSI